MIGEFTKFGICNPNEILECVNKCLDKFQGSNIEVISHALECSGRFLINTSQTSSLINSYLDIINDLKDKEPVNNRIIANME
jgi:hypothetical protein